MIINHQIKKKKVSKDLKTKSFLFYFLFFFFLKKNNNLTLINHLFI